MPRKRSYGFKFALLCFCREYDSHEKMKLSLKNSPTWRWILFVSFIIFLQYYYNTSYNIKKGKCDDILRKNINVSNTFHFVKRYDYHRRLMSYQRFLAMNYKLNDLGKSEKPAYNKTTPVCRIDMTALGPRTVNKTKLTLNWVERQLPQVLSGGFYAPKGCRSRHRVAILIPYRDRLSNLVIFLYHMHPMWQKQQLEYRVFVIEQYGHHKFNKGALFNIAFIETQRFGSWDCLFFHDVDLIPLDERVLYTCPRRPTHMSPAVESSKFQLQYRTLFGGVTSMTPKHFLEVNGYSNYYWNWGAEDDDMYRRLQASRLPMLRLNSTIARFATLSHKPQEVNPDRYRKLVKARKRFKTEGLKSVEYRLMSIAKKKLFTHVIADVNPFNYIV